MPQKIINMKKFFFVILVLVTLKATAQPGFSVEQSQVMMKMLSLKNSLIGKDSVILSGLLSDDVTYGHTNGIIQTKAQLIRSVMSGEQDYQSIEPSNMAIRVYENTGVVTMNSKVTMNYQGKPLEMNMFVTLVWIKNNNDWKLVARQSVKLN
jgi:ketosteroid isomerase-like protein